MKYFILFFFATIIFTNCIAQRDTKNGATQSVKEVVETGMIHTVYFWLADDITNERKMKFEKGLEDLSQVPSISKFYWGAPALTADRDVIDNSYDYAINVFFKSVEDEAAYQIDPIHLKFIEDHKEIFKEVKVYDNTIE